MKLDKEWAQLGVLAIVAFIAYKFLRRFSDVTSAITAPIATAVFNATAPARVRLLGRIMLPSGASTTVDAVVQAGGRITGDGFFIWQGTRYQISGRDASGAYTAKRIIT